MKTCRGCPHIALDQWPQGKQAVRCLYTGNGDRFGRVLHVVRAGNPHPDSVRTPEWCRKDETPSVSGRAAATSLREGGMGAALSVSFAATSLGEGGRRKERRYLYNSRARARIFADLLKGYL